jgi:hypothetical protein
MAKVISPVLGPVGSREPGLPKISRIPIEAFSQLFFLYQTSFHSMQLCYLQLEEEHPHRTLMVFGRGFNGAALFNALDFLRSR